MRELVISNTHFGAWTGADMLDAPPDGDRDVRIQYILYRRRYFTVR